jgi:hypothetical protein
MLIRNRHAADRAPSRLVKVDSSSDILDSAHYAEERRWLLDHTGIDLDLLRREPAFWLGLTVGTHVDKMRADLGINDA